MDLKRKEYEDAFIAWDAATTKYQNAMRALFKRQSLENLNVDDLIEDMAKCKSRLDVAAKPFTHGF